MPLVTHLLGWNGIPAPLEGSQNSTFILMRCGLKALSLDKEGIVYRRIGTPKRHVRCRLGVALKVKGRQRNDDLTY